MTLAYNSRLLTVTCTGLAAVGALLGQAQTAHACSPDPCEWSARFSYVDLRTQTVGEQGVLLFESYRGSESGGIDESALQLINVGVDLDDVDIPGQLELLEGFQGFVWRPDAPLPMGTTLDVQVIIDNAAIGEDSCGEDMLVEVGDVFVGANAPAVPSMPDVTTEQVYQVSPNRELDKLVCCDGAYPTEEYLCGSFPDVYWGGEGQCFMYEGTGSLTLEIQLDANAGPPDPLLADNVVHRLIKDGEPLPIAVNSSSFAVSDTEPFCVAVEAISAYTGEAVRSDEVCVGNDMVDELGPQLIDVEGELATCQGSAYVCEPMDNEWGGREWDPTDCRVWDEDDPLPGGTNPDSDSDSDSGSDSGPDSGSDSDTDSDSDSDTDGDEATGLTDRAEGCACNVSDDPTPKGWLLGGLALLGLRLRRRITDRGVRGSC